MVRKSCLKKWAAALCVTAALLCPGCGADRNQEDAAEAVSGNDARTDSYTLAVCPKLQWSDPENENLADLLQKQCGGMMVQISAGNHLGSGVIYDTQGDVMVIVTAAHVLADVQDTVGVAFFDGYEAECADFSVSERSDVAVLRIPLEQIPQENAAKYYRANVDNASYQKLEEGYGCIVMGCRDGVAADAYEGIILDPWIYMEDYGQHMIWVRAAGKAGMSGGGLFDRQGRYLGILSGVNEDDEWAVVPLGVVQAEL